METKVEKKRKLNPAEEVKTEGADNIERRVFIKFKDSEGNELDYKLDLPLATSVKELTEMINKLLANEDFVPYTFFFETLEIQDSLKEVLKKFKNITTETIIPITYHPESIFIVKPITRQSGSLEGHSEAVLQCSFSPNSRILATGSGDSTVRIWDIDTETPIHTCEGHSNWVLCIAWSPDCKLIASGSKDCTIRLWKVETGEQFGTTMKQHTQYISSLAWEPMHSRAEPKYFASSSKDGTVKIWNALNQKVEVSLSGHTGGVTKVIWGGQGLIYSASQDRTIKVWKPDGQLCHELKGHGHWVNWICVHTEYALRTACYSEVAVETDKPEEMQKIALERYNKAKGKGDERMISCSDDHTLYLWDPVKSSKPITRLTGHQQPVINAQFSPDGKYLVSASFDKSLKLWDGYTGQFINTLRGHFQQVYQCAWSIDSRMLVSGSKDSTLKVWTMKSKKMMFDLPGHADEVYSVDWSPDGEKVASGGKDRLVKLWRH